MLLYLEVPYPHFVRNLRFQMVHFKEEIPRFALGMTTKYAFVISNEERDLDRILALPMLSTYRPLRSSAVLT